MKNAFHVVQPLHHVNPFCDKYHPSCETAFVMLGEIIIGCLRTSQYGEHATRGHSSDSLCSLPSIGQVDWEGILYCSRSFEYRKYLSNVSSRHSPTSPTNT